MHSCAYGSKISSSWHTVFSGTLESFIRLTVIPDACGYSHKDVEGKDCQCDQLGGPTTIMHISISSYKLYFAKELTHKSKVCAALFARRLAKAHR